MILLIRVILIATIIYLLLRSFARYSSSQEEAERHPDPESGNKIKKISKEVGEYVDYEEVE
jgi:hypothetical protein